MSHQYPCIWHILKVASEAFPRAEAVIDGPISFDYQTVANRVRLQAHHLKQLGIKPRDRISVLLDNQAELLEAYFVAPALGAILVPLNTRLHPEQIACLLQHHETSLIIVNESYQEVLQHALMNASLPSLKHIITVGHAHLSNSSYPCSAYQDLLLRPCQGHFTPFNNSPNDVAQIYYTSGTTGEPKGVMLTHNNVCRHAKGVVEELKIRRDDRWGHIAPMFHLADAWAVFAITMVGGVHIMQRRFKADDTLALICDKNITITNLVPTMLNLMLKSPHISYFDYSSLRLLLSGGAPIAPATVKAIINVFKCPYIQTYGLTETSPYLTFSILTHELKQLNQETQLHWMCKTGRPFKLIDLKLLDKAGQPVPCDDKTVGEVVVKGPTITPGYWNNPKATQEAFDEQGYFHTGDLAVIDEYGYINIVDRIKDVIISGGETIYTVEIVSCLYEHPAILEAAVFGLLDETWGEVVAAAVVLKPGEHCLEADIMAFCRKHLANYQIPRKLFFYTELPKTGSGKIKTNALRALYSSKMTNSSS